MIEGGIESASQGFGKEDFGDPEFENP